MIQRFVKIITAAMMALAITGISANLAYAADPLAESCKVDPTAPICQSVSSSKPLFGANSFWTNLINTMIYVIGAISVLMIVIGGLRYTISGGDSGQTKSAKDTIIYAVVGVVIAILSYVILNFVVVNLVAA